MYRQANRCRLKLSSRPQQYRHGVPGPNGPATAEDFERSNPYYQKEFWLRNPPPQKPQFSQRIWSAPSISEFKPLLDADTLIHTCPGAWEAGTQRQVDDTAQASRNTLHDDDDAALI
jgi:hypothetical protein